MLERALLGAKEAAYYLGGISIRTLWSLTRPRGPIPAVRIGRRVFYRKGDLQEWLERQAHQQSAPAGQEGRP